ncbi:MAG: Verru_Chthon cassette protein B [Prosthecobacter sp.]|nr:Verru_Chthon cassette protein B [Prosthecobacter sp.]
MKTHRSLSSRAGFSLVEVTLAVAIAALGFITLLGLLPQGITMARDASRMATGSRIIQKLSGEMQSSSWDKITWNGYGPLRYFTSEGVEITPQESDPDDALATSLSYVAAVQVPEQALDVMLPSGGASASGAGEPHLRRVRICVASTANPEFDFTSASPLLVTSASVLIARMGN